MLNRPSQLSWSLRIICGCKVWDITQTLPQLTDLVLTTIGREFVSFYLGLILQVPGQIALTAHFVCSWAQGDIP